MLRVLYACHLDVTCSTVPPFLTGWGDLSEVANSHKYFTSQVIVFVAHCIEALLIEVGKFVTKSVDA
jgi:hypothetical protein